MNAWQRYKQKLGEARPWDALNGENYVPVNLSKQRMDICLSCDRLLMATKQCKECGCFMSIKTRLTTASCPLNKW